MKVLVKRDTRLTGRFSDILVLLDEKRIGYVRHGETLAFDCPEGGMHMLTMKTSGSAEPKSTYFRTTAEPRKFLVGAKMEFSRTYPWSITIRQIEYEVKKDEVVVSSAPAARPGGRLGQHGLVLPYVASLVAMVVLVGAGLKLVVDTKNHRQADGTVLSYFAYAVQHRNADLVTYCCRYAYEVEGRHYEGVGKCVDQSATRKREKKITVYYKPDCPGEGSLRKGGDFAETLNFCMTASLFALIILIGVCVAKVCDMDEVPRSTLSEQCGRPDKTRFLRLVWYGLCGVVLALLSPFLRGEELDLFAQVPCWGKWGTFVAMSLAVPCSVKRLKWPSEGWQVFVVLVAGAVGLALCYANVKLLPEAKEIMESVMVESLVEPILAFVGFAWMALVLPINAGILAAMGRFETFEEVLADSGVSCGTFLSNLLRLGGVITLLMLIVTEAALLVGRICLSHVTM